MHIGCMDIRKMFANKDQKPCSFAIKLCDIDNDDARMLSDWPIRHRGYVAGLQI